MHHVILFSDSETPITVGQATTEAEASAMFATVYHIDSYDAEDGPRVARYDPDGCGCFIVDGILA